MATTSADRLSESDIANLLSTANYSAYSEKELPKGYLLRSAAVLVPLYRFDGSWHLLFTRRTDKVVHHKGQVSFPGGATDPDDDSPEATALREADEEIGLKREDVNVLGRLAPMVTISDYLVTPVVGVIKWPYAFRVHTPEVGRVFTIPLNWLADSRNYMKMVRTETGRHIITYLPFDGELLWGATAHMTVEFLKTLQVI